MTGTGAALLAALLSPVALSPQDALLGYSCHCEELGVEWRGGVFTCMVSPVLASHAASVSS